MTRVSDWGKLFIQQLLSADPAVKVKQRLEAWQAYAKLKALLWSRNFILKAMWGVYTAICWNFPAGGNT